MGTKTNFIWKYYIEMSNYIFMQNSLNKWINLSQKCIYMCKTCIFHKKYLWILNVNRNLIFFKKWFAGFILRTDQRCIASHWMKIRLIINIFKNKPSELKEILKNLFDKNKRKDEIVKILYGAQLQRQDFMKLSPDTDLPLEEKWLNDQIINSYMDLVAHSNNKVFYLWPKNLNNWLNRYFRSIVSSIQNLKRGNMNFTKK